MVIYQPLVVICILVYTKTVVKRSLKLGGLEMLQNMYKRAKQITKISIKSIPIISIAPLIYSFVKKGPVFKRVFDFNYLIASIIIIYGIFVFFIPVNLKKTNRLVDHSNASDVIREENEKKYEGAIESIFWGISNILIVGVIELVLRVLL